MDENLRRQRSRAASEARRKVFTEYVHEPSFFEKMTEEQLNRILGMEPGRPAIMKLAVPRYKHDASRYPEKIRVSFMDGHTEVYEIRTEQPAPVIVENIRIIRKWKKGYVNQPETRRGRK